MKKLAGMNITRTAIWVALLSIVPAMAIIVMTALARYTDEVAATRARGESFVRLIAERQTQVTEVVSTLAQVLVDLKRVRAADAAGTSVLFDVLANNSPEYSNIFLLRDDGSVIASGLPLSDDMNFSQYTFFRRVLRRKAFSVGSVQDSLFDKKSIVYFGAPVPFARGGMGVLGISLNLTRYKDTLAGLGLHKDAVVYLLDGSGALAGVSPPGSAVPGSMLGGEVWRGVQNEGADAGSFFVPDALGKGRVWVSYRKLFLPESDMPYFYVLYTRPVTSSYFGARALVWHDLALAAAVILLSVAVAAGLYLYAVQRPWRALYETALRMAGGDLAARVPEKGVGGEIGLLGKEFNAMAEVLEKRDKELSAARDYAELSRQAKSEFLANMSHEIRTSMNAILGMAYLVMKTDLNLQQKGYISKLLAAANTLLRTINDILDFSKMEAGKMAVETVSFSLRRILGNVRSESSARLAEKQLGFVLELDPAVPEHLMGDPLRLSQALLMLVDDAITRSEQGDVFLSAALAAREGEGVTIAFTIRNAGAELTDSQVSEFKDIFVDGDDEAVVSTLDRQRLRLAIAGRLFRLMGGGITLERVADGGVSFSASAAFICGQGELHRPGRFFENTRALVIDPGVVSSQDLVEILGHFGVCVVCVPDLEAARKALDNAQITGTPYNVIFADWRTSQPDFPEQVLRMKGDATLTVAPRVIITMPAGRAELPVSPDELDVDALLPKPVNDSLVFDTLVTVLGTCRDKETEQQVTEDKVPGDLAGLRVLLVEDNSVNQQIAQEIMEAEGIEVTIADNGAEAITLLSEGTSRWDMVLMDLQMPKMDGFAATRAIRIGKGLDSMQLPIIAMTAHSDVSEISACFAAGMNDHTGKPIVVETFFATLRRWLPVEQENGAPLTRGTARLRKALISGVPSEVEAALDGFEPLLGVGRDGVLRAALREGGPGAADDMLTALENLARTLRAPEGRAS